MIYKAWQRRQDRLVYIQRIQLAGILKILATSLMSTVLLGKGDNRKGEDVTCQTRKRDPARWNMFPHSFPTIIYQGFG